MSERSARIRRGVQRRCARCGERDVWASFYELKDRCPRCGYLFVREDGYWVGAMTVLIVLTEIVFGIVFVGGMILTWPDVPWTFFLVTGLVLNAVVPIAFYPWSKTTWIGLDLFFNPPSATEEADSLTAREGRPPGA